MISTVLLFVKIVSPIRILIAVHLMVSLVVNTLFILRNTRVCVDITDSGNVFTNTKILVDNHLSFRTIL